MNRLTILLVCSLVLACALSAPAQQPIEDKAVCRSTWDGNYLYFSFKIDCADVQSKRSAPNADVSGDDSVTVYIETDNKHAENITPSCFSMAVTAAGGSQFCSGTDDGKFEPTTVFTFRYGATVQGTLNNSDDIDTGYTVEMALPWALLKTQPPKPGDMMSFNIVIRRHGSPSELISLAPRVKAERDALDPSKWSNIVFTTFSFVATSGAEKVLCSRSIAMSPLINGLIDEREWPKTSAFTIALPAPPGFVYEAKFPIQHMVLSAYYYDFQADPRKTAAWTKLAAPDGGIALQDFPAKSLGPWFSSDRVQWHKEQAADMIAAGIDVMLPVYRGDKSSRAAYADKGLDCLVSALAELKIEGKAYPLVGMCFDLSSLEAAYGKKPNLAEQEVMRAFYGMVKSFFDRVPVEFRAFAQTGKPEAGRTAPILLLIGAQAIDDALIGYVNQRFEQDFGSPLVWIVSGDANPAPKGADGFVSYGAQTEASCQVQGRVKICSVSAGYDDSASASGEPFIRSRAGGEVYDKAWAAAIGRSPHWILCDNWNDFARGSELCASREYGRKYIDSTLANVKRFRGARDFDAQFLRCSMPKAIQPRSIVQAELVIRNIGNSPWRTPEGFAVAYRWYRSGRFVSESKARRPLDGDVLPGETVTVPVGIATVDANNVALPEGSYELRIEMVRLSDNKWFSALGDQALTVPVTVGAVDDWRAAFISCDCPVLVAAGQGYKAKIRVRNEGVKTWTKGRVKLGCKLFKVSNYTHDCAAEFAELIPTADMRSLLLADCKPGEIATFVIGLDFSQPNKKPLESSRPDQLWHYELRFDIYNGEEWLSELGSPKLRRAVGLYDSDYSARIVDCSLPPNLTAGRSYDVKVVVRNTGVVTWSRSRTRLGYHWYHLDGNEMQWDCEGVPVGQDIKPGWPVVLNAKVKAPEYDGRYILAWDVKVDDVWLSTQPITRGGDMLPVFVEVTGGKLVFADLTNLCDVCATSPDTARTSGDFDGKGRSFPAEFFPPDAGLSGQSDRIYPSGYKWVRDNLPEGRISFAFVDKSPGAKNAVSCRGQKVVVDRGNYLALHIAAASTDGTAPGEFSLNYSDGADTAKLNVQDWSTVSRPGGRIACAARHTHSHGGDEIGKPCRLYHYTIPLDRSRTLTSITLPSNPAIKVAAITLERVSLPPAPAQ